MWRNKGIVVLGMVWLHRTRIWLDCGAFPLYILLHPSAVAFVWRPSRTLEYVLLQTLFGLCLMNCWASSTELPIPPKPAALALPGSTAGACRGKDCTCTLLPAETLQWVRSLAHPCTFPSQMALLLDWALLWVWRRPGWRFNQNSPHLWACRVWYQVTALQASSCLQWIVQQFCPAGSPRSYTACASQHFLTQHPILTNSRISFQQWGSWGEYSSFMSSFKSSRWHRPQRCGDSVYVGNPNICLIFKEVPILLSSSCSSCMCLPLFREIPNCMFLHGSLQDMVLTAAKKSFGHPGKMNIPYPSPTPRHCKSPFNTLGLWQEAHVQVPHVLLCSSTDLPMWFL